MTSQLINYGERPPYWKSSIGYISTTDCPINANFGTKKQNHVHTHKKVTWPKYQNSKIQDGGRPPFWKCFSAISQPEIIRFGWNLVTRRKFWFQERSHEKVSKFSKFKMADSCYIENRFSYISRSYCPINTKFGTEKQNHTRAQVSAQNTKIRKFTMADGRHFENGFIATSRPRIIRIRRKFDLQMQILILIARMVTWQKLDKNFANIIENTRPMRNAKRSHLLVYVKNISKRGSYVHKLRS